MNQKSQNINQEKVVEVVAGIDVGKAHLDVHIEPTEVSLRWPSRPHRRHCAAPVSCSRRSGRRPPVLPGAVRWPWSLAGAGK